MKPQIASISAVILAAATLSAAGFPTLHPTAHAAGICDALKASDDAAVHVAGEIIDVDPEGAIEIRDDCGSILVFAPGETQADAQAKIADCKVGGVAEAIGGIAFGSSVDANTLLCE